MIRRYNELFVIPKLTYLGDATDSYSVKQFLQDYLSFLILFNYLIPISLYVTIELQRVIGSWFMEWDLELYENETDQPCVVNTSNLNEELGQINILFSDKTGTLTKNEMNFQQCSINGSKFLFKKTRLEDEETKALLDINKFSVSLFHRYSLSGVPKSVCRLSLQANQRVFFQALSICHTVQVASGSLEQADAGTAKREPVTAIKSGPPEMYSISDITEESHNASQQSELNVGHTIDNSVSAHPNGVNSTTISSDVNPLLVSDDGYGVERRKRPVVIKRSPNFARSNRMNNGAASDLNINQTDPNTVTNGVEPTTNFRPISLQFRRSTSEKDLQQSWEAPSGQAPGHRRAHSYGAPNAYLTNPVTASTPPAGVLFRSPSTTSRESYAAPTFTRQPTILVRAESQRRKNEIRDFIL